MEEKDIEKLLKESADEVKVKGFSERWENIKDRICSTPEVEVKETISETVLTTSVNSNFSQNPVRKKIIIFVCTVFLLIVLCLAIVLPITLKKDNEQIYFNLNELTSVTVSKNEFYDNLEKTDLEIFSLEKFEVSNIYVLYYSENNTLVGGKFEIVDENDGVVAEVIFYDTSVKSLFEIGTDYKAYSINGFDLEYKTELNGDELYSTTAKAVSSSISYEFECLSLDENIEAFFEKIFG